MFVKDVYLSSIAGDGKNDPGTEAVDYPTQVTIPNHPGQTSPHPTPAPGVHLARSTFTELKEKVNGHSGKMLEGSPKSRKAGDTAIVSMAPSQSTRVESFPDWAALDCSTVCD